MSSTIYRERGSRFFFFSREEARIHVHLHCAAGEAKYWLQPEIALARSYGISAAQLTKIKQIIEAHQDDFIDAWNSHFES